MKTKLVRIGNSRGIRLSKGIIDQAGLTEEVDLSVRQGSIVIARVSAARSGWAEAARQMRQHKEDVLLDSPVSTKFDEKEWKW